jgi:two-component system, chemotaxis family, CheB/CheR fusion protein
VTRTVHESTTSKEEAANPSPAEQMEEGLLRHGDGKLPIVGLGGSAGGIAALQKFFAAMPVDSGMAFVVILHLSPQHESILAQMLQRSTAMPVVAATDGVTVEPSSVYVIPPGKFLASIDGHLRLTDAEEPRGKRVAVDYFFRTLAETHGAQALAVVLSGSGGDGALGIKRIKEFGGLTIAQDPDEAEHPEMPRAAIATGVVDWVLAVNEMPAKLLAYVKQRGALKLPDEDGPHPAEAVALSPDEHETALHDVLAFLHTRTGRDFSCYKRATILRRIARRMQVNGLADLPGYLMYLHTHAGEAGALLQDLLISVTNFFRDPAPFAALKGTIPELFKGKGPGDTVRVWVAGCATGEEAYSIAILLWEHAGTLVGPPHLQVFATDLDEEVIREAREGIYPETIAADVSEERLKHFFIHEQGSYRVRRAVREIILFTPHDLLKDSPFSRLDLVSCRNLLIYLNQGAQSRAFDIFHFALRPGGRLFLGTSEAVDDGSPLFTVLDKKQRLYVQRPAPRRFISVPTGAGMLARPLVLQERSRERPTVPGRGPAMYLRAPLDQVVPFDSGLPPAELHYRLIEHLSPPSILVNSEHEIVHLSESAGRFLHFAGGEPTRNLLLAVHPMLRLELRGALYAAVQTHTVATAVGVLVEMGEARSLVDIRVTPAGHLAPNFLLVVFKEQPAHGAAAVAAPRNANADQAALHLERELVATKAQLRDTIEQFEASTEELKASNEELQAMNEELRSATEELETSREEMQSINEELTAVNNALTSNVESLAQSNSDLQNLMSATSIATVFLDRDLRIKLFTPSAKMLFNLISTDLGRPLADLNGGLDYPEIVADAERSLAHLQPVQREVRADARWYSARILPYRTNDDHIAGVVLSFLDITALKETEHALRASEARFRAAAGAVSSLIWTNNAQGQMEGEQPGWESFTGQAQASYQGYGWSRAVHPDDAQPSVDAWSAAVSAKKTFMFEHRVLRRDGQWRLCSVRAVPVFDERGELREWVGVHTDITDRSRAEAESHRLAAELSAADRRKDEFLSILAHELRNPLAPIRHGVELIRMAGGNEVVERALLMMDRQVAQLIRLVDDLVDLSRVTSGKLELRLEPIELRAVIHAAVETSRPVIEQARHALVLVMPDQPMFVSGDHVRLAQVVSNLLNNSAKYTHRGGQIRLAVRRERETAVVSVKDDGIGIPPAMLGSVFEMFVQVDRTLEKTTGGLGIGLSLVKRLVEMHGGTVESRSEGEGLGAEFLVRLPVVVPDPSTPAPSDRQAKEVAMPGRRILVVDDNEDAADLLAELLQTLGNSVRTAYDGEAAGQAAGEFLPEVIFCDIGMPKINGYEVARRIREQPWARETVLVALTGWGDEAVRKKSSAAGFDFHLVKPVAPAALMKLLADLAPAT